MSFGIFKHSSELDWVVLEGQQSVETLKKLRKEIGNNALPAFLIEYIEAVSQGGAGLLAIHTASSIEGYGSKANQKTISRAKGFMGKSQLETKRFPDAVHHVKIFRNKQGRARLFYKFAGSLQFVQNPKDMPDD